MKRKFAFALLASTVLATGAAGGNQVFGQSRSEPSRQPNNGDVGQNNGPYQNPSLFNPAPPIYPAGSPVPPTVNGYIAPPGMLIQPYTPQVRYPVYPGGMSGYPGGMSGTMPGMGSHGSPRYTVVNKDGSIESIGKEPGAKLSKEEFDLLNETRQKVQNAVSQLRSPDTDESKRKDAKELIAKYLKAEFQSDQKSRRDHVERLEKQVEQLKKQLSKRDESQDKLIELRLQLLENDASGLSFPESWVNLPGLPPMNSNVHFHPTNLGMQPSILGQTYSNPATFSPSPDVGRAISPSPAPPVQTRY